MKSTGLMCAVLLDTKGPEIRTGMLKGGKPVLMEAGREVTIHTDYTLHGDEYNIAMSYAKLPEDVRPGAQILIGDGSIVMVAGAYTRPLFSSI
jgi:pyruvate kinase